MRLINLVTLQLEDFADERSAPPFAILSHTWGPEEVTLQDFKFLPRDDLETRQGWTKITGFCAAVQSHQSLLSQAVCHGWVDTCCIDKTSSAELSEAINSMFRWYRHAVACFVFLADAQLVQDASSGQHVFGSDFERSRWFTRGWTLQELLAPGVVYFFDADWRHGGSMMSMAERIAQRAGIDLDVILTGSWDSCCVAERMSWAADRTTTRLEDMAYCLLGIFGVSMPLLYGEGVKAFIRLQEEIMKESDDQSILAWDSTNYSNSVHQIGALATSPAYFNHGAAIESLPPAGNSFTMTPRGIQAHLTITMFLAPGDQKTPTLAMLSCRYANDMNSLIGIPLQPDLPPAQPSQQQRYSRARSPLISVPLYPAPMKPPPAIYLVKLDQQRPLLPRRRRFWLRYSGLSDECAPRRNYLHPDWHVSPGKSMTMIFPRWAAEQQGQSPFCTVVPFAYPLPGEGATLAVVLRLDYGGTRAAVGLRILEKAPQLDEQLLGLAKAAHTVATGPEAECSLPLLGESAIKPAMLRRGIHAQVVVADNFSTFMITLKHKEPMMRISR